MRLLPIIAMLVLAACGADAGEPAQDPAEPTAPATAERTAAPTSRPAPANRLTPRPSPTPVARDDITLVEFGYSYFPGSTTYVQFAVVFENPNPGTWVAERTRVNITWYKADGSVAGSTDETIRLGLPGQRFATAGVAFNVFDPADMEVQWRTEWMEIDFTPGEFTFEGVNSSNQQFGRISTTGNVRSSFEQEQEFIQVVAVYKDAGGNVLGGDATYVDFVPPDGTASFEIRPLGDLSGFATTDLYASP